MKVKMIAVTIIACMALIGCGGSGRNDAANADTNQIDTSMSAQDTTMFGDTTNVDTNSTTNQNGSNSNIR